MQARARGTTFALPSAAADPTVCGITLTINTVPPGNGTSSLAASGCVGLGRPAGSRGFKCVMEPLFHKVLIKPTGNHGGRADLRRAHTLRILLAFPSWTATATTLDVAIILDGGTERHQTLLRTVQRSSGGKRDGSEYLGKDTPAPAACW